MMRPVLWTIGLAALVLTACGGSDSTAPVSDTTLPISDCTPPISVSTPPISDSTPPISDSTPSIPLAGTLAVPFTKAIVCVDSNRNFACDANESLAQLEPSGSFSILIQPDANLSQTLLVAELDSLPNPDTSAVATRLTLAASAAGDRRISALSTLVALPLLAQPTLNLEQSIAQVDARLGLARYSVGDSQAYPGWAPLEAATLAALSRLAAAPLETEAGPQTPAETVRGSTEALTTTIKRYIDPTTESLLQTVDGRTLASEVHYLTGGQACTDIAPLPQLRLDTEGAAPIVSKDNYLNATFHFVGAAQHNDDTVFKTEIKGHGNTTWSMPKKPYRLKLSKKARLLGLPEVKSYALLANYSDKTLLRNAVALCTARQLGLDYTPSDHFLELYLNGAYQGVYQLTDKVYRLKKIIEDDEIVGTAEHPDPADGFLLDLDIRMDEDLRFRSRRYVPYTLQMDSSAAQRDVIEAYINDIEDRIFDTSQAARLTAVAQAVDLGTLIDFYLVNELTKNRDAFRSSTYLYRFRDGKLKYGPVWDFDVSSGNYDENSAGEPRGWWLGHTEFDLSLRELIQIPEFAAHLKARWQYLLTRTPDRRRFIDCSAKVMQEPQTRNFQKWDILGKYVWPNRVVTGSYAAEVAYLREWLEQRSAWISQQLQQPKPWGP